MLTYFQKNKFFILSAAFILALLAGCLVKTYDDKLVTPEARYKIVSLELAWSEKKAQNIVGSWNRLHLKETALTSVRLDYLFIAAYTLFLACCVLARNPAGAPNLSRWTRIFLTLCLVAAAGDIVENLFLTPYITYGTLSPYAFFIPSTIKWVAVAAVIVYILLFLRHHWTLLRELLPALWLYLAGIIFAFIGYFLFIRVSAGRDVIIQIGEWSGPFWWTLFSVPMWAVISWYSARVVGYQKTRHIDPTHASPAETVILSLHLHLPRIIAFNATVCVQAAIWALPTVAGLDQCQLWAFVIGQNLFYFAWHILPLRRQIAISVVVIIAYAVVSLRMAYYYHPGTTIAIHQRHLPLIAFLLFVIELSLLWLFVLRRARLDKTSSAAAKQTVPYTLTVASREIKTPLWLPAEEWPFFRKFNIFAGLGIVVYLAAFLSPGLDNSMGPLAVALLAFGVLLGVSNMITVYSIYKRLNFFFLLFVLAILVGIAYNPYKVRLHEFQEKETIPVRPDLKTYFHNWAEKRRHLICAPACDTFDVYVVIANGGASRSGYWTSSVLSALQDESIKKDPDNTFADHLLCLAGASGGGVGVATFYAQLTDTIPTRRTHRERTHDFLKEDFLSPVLAHWFGADLIQHFVPLNLIGVGDRAQALEESMERFYLAHGDSTFFKPFTRAIDTSGRLPALFLNTTHVQEGVPAEVSSIDISTFSQRLDVLDSLDPRTDLRYSTAVVLGARFPYVSPAGAIGKRYFVDGGYFDNTGAGIVHEMLQYLDSATLKSEDADLYSKLRINLIYLGNFSLAPSKENNMHPLVNDAAAPVLTVLGTYASQTSINNQRLVSYIKELNPKSETLTINLYTREPIDYPMNWVISDYNLDLMKRRLNTALTQTECTTILKQIKGSNSEKLTPN